MEKVSLLVEALFNDKEGEDYYISSNGLKDIMGVLLKLEDKAERLEALRISHREFIARENVLGFVKDPELGSDHPGMYFLPSTKLGDRRWRRQQLNKLRIVEFFLRNNLVSGKDEVGSYTNCGFVSLTVDPKKFTSEIDAWFMIKKKKDAVMKRLRRFGVADYIAIVESMGNGFPHLHLIVIFKDVYHVRFHKNKNDGAIRFLFPCRVRDGIRKAWPFGYIDVFGALSEKQISEYLMKDIAKNSTRRRYRHTYKADINHAFLSYCNMKFMTYSRAISDLIVKTVTKDSPEDMSDRENISCMMGLKYHFLGVFPVSFLTAGLIPEKYTGLNCGYDPPDRHLDVFRESLRARHPERKISIEFECLYGAVVLQQKLFPIEYPKGPFCFASYEI